MGPSFALLTLAGGGSKRDLAPRPVRETKFEERGDTLHFYGEPRLWRHGLCLQGVFSLKSSSFL